MNNPANSLNSGSPLTAAPSWTVDNLERRIASLEIAPTTGIKFCKRPDMRGLYNENYSSSVEKLEHLEKRIASLEKELAQSFDSGFKQGFDQSPISAVKLARQV